MLEGYSNGSGSYRKFSLWNLFRPWKVETNAHWGTSAEDHRKLGARRGGLSGDPAKKFEYYRLEWKPGSMTVFYGPHAVRRITQEQVLTGFAAKRMRIVINNAVRTDAGKLDGSCESDFEVRYFSYRPL